MSVDSAKLMDINQRPSSNQMVGYEWIFWSLIDKGLEREAEAVKQLILNNRMLTKVRDGWVPCSQMMPKNGHFFIAFGENIGDYVGMDMAICRWDGDLWVEGGTELAYDNQKFTHWMPLPNQPCVLDERA